jgi:hypothetical protein
MRIRLLLAATAAVTLAACSESSTAPHQLSPNSRPSADMDITCRSGYHIATRSDGTEYCEADGGAQAAATTTTSSASSTD